MKTANLSPIVRSAEIKQDVMHILGEFGYRTDTVTVEIFGIPYNYTEHELRALQVLVARTSQDNPEEGRNLCDNITIYYPGTEDEDEGHILPDGRLDNPLPGFIDTNDRLSLELLHIIHRVG